MLSVTAKSRKFNFKLCYVFRWVGIAQLVQRLARDYTAWGSNPGGGEIFRSRPDRPWGPLSLLYNEYRVFPVGKAAGCDVDILTLLAPRLKKEQTLHYFPLWSFAACSRGNFTFHHFATFFGLHGHYQVLVFNKNIKENYVKIISEVNNSFLYKCIHKVKHFDSSRPKNGIHLVLKCVINRLLKKTLLVTSSLICWFLSLN